MDLVAQKLSRTYFRDVGEANFFYAIKDIDLEVKEGCFALILGKSGSGKTTLLNILSGLLSPTEGKVKLGETDICSLSDKERSRFRNAHFGIIPQGQTGLQNLTIEENIALPSMLYQKKEKPCKTLMERLEIAHLSKSYPNEVSGGELRRMAIARALINDPEVLFADEPTGDLDEENTANVLAILQSLKREGKIIVMATHDKDALPYADMVYRMDKGILTPMGQGEAKGDKTT